MNASIENITELLQKKNIKPSYPRIKVMEYLITKKSHPTVDEIYNRLVKELPTLSKTTVYNTLGLLAEAKLARIITIEDNETRYDADMSYHGHFKCDSCGMIYDFPINMNDFVTEALAQFKINEKNVYLNGICPNCLGKNK